VPLIRTALLPAVALALWGSACPARADERPTTTSVELLAGDGSELVKVGSSGPSAYGFGLGMRAGITLPARLYLGGTFVQHVGWVTTASSTTTSSTYRGAYHVTYGGAEIGWAFERHGLLVRPYAGSGMLLAFGRTDVRRVTRVDDRALFYVAPGVLTAARFGARAGLRPRWYGGFDMRLIVTPALPTSEWAPALFFVVGTEP
jgi:hypothetical protein